tara:strand:- start:2961 stop:3584 length:624 start_codon:yes stop_codon:yes gene_type:complete
MGNVESQKKEPNIKDTIEKNKKIVITLNKRLEHLEKKIELEKNNALEKIKNKKKQSALINLKKKKMYEKQVNNLYSQIGNLEQQIIVLESSAINTNVIDTMKISNNTLKKINKENNIEKVEDLIDNIDEQINLNNEVNQLLSNPINDLENDQELLEELENLNRDDFEQNTHLPKLPQAPNNKVSFNIENNNIENEKDALEQLELIMQ